MALLRDVIYEGELSVLPFDVYRVFQDVWRQNPTLSQRDAIVQILLDIEVDPDRIHDPYAILQLAYEVVKQNPPVQAVVQDKVVPVLQVFPEELVRERVYARADAKCVRFDPVDSFVYQRSNPVVAQSEFVRLRDTLRVPTSITVEQLDSLIDQSASFQCVTIERPAPETVVTEEEQFAIDPELQAQMSDEAQEALDIADTAQDIADVAAEEAQFAAQQAEIAAQSGDEQAAADAAKAAEVAQIAADAAAKAAEEARAAAKAGDLDAVREAIDVAQEASDIVTEAAAKTESIVTGQPIDTGVVAKEDEPFMDDEYGPPGPGPQPAKKTVQKSTKAEDKGGVPTWALVAGGAAVLALVAFGGKKKR